MVIFLMFLLLADQTTEAATKNSVKLNWNVSKIEVIPDVEHGSVSKVSFSDKRVMAGVFFDSEFVGVLERPSGPPYLIFKGRECTECCAKIGVLITSPKPAAKSKQGVEELVIEKQLSAPGKLLANEANYSPEEFKPGPISEEYLFLNGKTACAAFPTNSLVWFQYFPRRNGDKYFVHVGEVGANGAFQLNQSPSSPQVLEKLRKDKALGKCKEVPALDQTESP